MAAAVYSCSTCREAGRETFPMPLRSCSEAAAKLLQSCCEAGYESLPMLPLTHSYADAGFVAKLLRSPYGAITRLRSCSDAVVMLWRSRCELVTKLLQCWLRSRETCSETVPMTPRSFCENVANLLRNISRSSSEAVAKLLRSCREAVMRP